MARRRTGHSRHAEHETEDGRRREGNGVVIGRRTFLKLTGLTFGAASMPGLQGCSCDSEKEAAVPSFVVTALRPEDFVVLRFEFFGLDLNEAGDALVPVGSGERLIAVTHASQHLLEEALLEKAGNGPSPTKQPVRALIGGTSRVVFRVPDDVEALGYGLRELLEACASYEMKVSPNAAPPAEPAQAVIDLGSEPAPASLQTSASTRASFETVDSQRHDRARQQLSQSSGLDVVTSATVDPRVADLLESLTPGEPRPPTDTETALELPFRLLISPSHLGGWAHATEPVEHNGRVELWHSRLGVRRADGTVDEQQAYLRTIRALWARDMDRPALPAPHFEASLEPHHRVGIVNNSSNFDSGTPLPVDVERLMLTGLGAWLDAVGSWPERSLEYWEHRATMGRDHFVKVVEKGYLYPFGHRAVLVTITERKLERPEGYSPGSGPDPEHVAFLWKRSFIIVREPVKSYPASRRKLPFTALHIKQLVTPLLEGTHPTNPFVPMVDGAPFRFVMEAVDRGGGVSRFDAAVVFVHANDDGSVKSPGQAAGLYAPHNEVRLAGQRVAFAAAAEPDDTTFEARRLFFVEEPDGTGTSTPGFAPGLQKALLNVEAIRHLSGNANAAEVEYHPVYLSDGFEGQNAHGQVLFALSGNGVDLSFSSQSDKSGGFLSPDMDVSGLSRSKGPVSGDPGAFAAGSFEPDDFFDKIDAKIFGVFELKDIIQKLSGNGALDNAPRFVSQALDAVEGFVHDMASLLGDLDRYTTQLPSVPGPLSTALAALESANAPIGETTSQSITNVASALTSVVSELEALSGAPPAGLNELLLSRARRLQDVIGSGLAQAIEAYNAGKELARDLTVRLEWRPKIQSFAGIFMPNREDGLLLSLESRGKDLPGKPAGTDLIACIEDFNINLVGENAFLRIPFTRLELKVASGQKPEIQVAFGAVRFDGILAFVQKLAEIIPAEGLSDGPDIEVGLDGITAGLTLPLPNLAVGIFSLENISFSAKFNIPFIGPPITTRFAFSSREQPFVLTVSMLGGGGFFAITASPGGVEVLEAALEFGARLSMDFGVASGSVSVAAGVYFEMVQTDVSLTGYLRIRGEVSVLRLIKISIELMMELIYEFSSHKILGRATLEVEVSVLCFTVGVKIQVERKFAGSNEDPTFLELMEPQGDYKPWNEYLAAFAA